MEQELSMELAVVGGTQAATCFNRSDLQITRRRTVKGH